MAITSKVPQTWSNLTNGIAYQVPITPSGEMASNPFSTASGQYTVDWTSPDLSDGDPRWAAFRSTPQVLAGYGSDLGFNPQELYNSMQIGSLSGPSPLGNGYNRVYTQAPNNTVGTQDIAVDDSFWSAVKPLATMAALAFGAPYLADALGAASAAAPAAWTSGYDLAMGGDLLGAAGAGAGAAAAGSYAIPTAGELSATGFGAPGVAMTGDGGIGASSSLSGLGGAGAGAAGYGTDIGASALTSALTSAAPSAASNGSSMTNILTNPNALGGLANLGGSIIGGITSNNAASKAADAQVQAARTAADTQLKMFNTVNDQQEPYRQAGQTALSSLVNGVGAAPAAGSLTSTYPAYHAFNASDLKSNLAPNYDFQLQQGLGAINNQASVLGGQTSGNTLKAINDYAQNFAGNAYQNAFNNYNTSYQTGFNANQTNQTNIFNRLAAIAGIGQASNQQMAQTGTALAGNIGSAQLASGAAQAAGAIGRGNAIGQTANSIGGTLGWYGMNSNPISSASNWAGNNVGVMNSQGVTPQELQLMG